VLTHIRTGKKYVGQTVNMARRLKQHINTPPRRMLKDMGDHEHKNFETYVSVATLEQHNMTKATANLLEAGYITDMGTTDTAVGYNDLPGSPGHSPSFWARRGRQLKEMKKARK